MRYSGLSADDQASRWKSEAAFFDSEAVSAKGVLSPTLPSTLERYSRLRRRRWNKEYRFRLLGDLKGLKVLDVGCGDGVNSVLLAQVGAEVTGIDISPSAIAVASARAELDGVQSRTRFLCSPIETAELEPASFDVVWVDAVLHHVLPVLEPTLQRLATCLRPGGRLVVSEPVNLSPMLRRLRLALPVPTHATPGERPLEAEELATVSRVFPGTRVRYFHLFGRLIRFLLPDGTLETAVWWRRESANIIALLDLVLLRLPLIRRLGGVGVFFATTPSNRTASGAE